MDKVIPLFKSHYSLGRSILTLEKESVPYGPDSIIDIASQASLKRVFLVEDSMSGFLEAYKNLKEKGISLSFGLRMTVCHDLKEKSEESLGKSAKYIVFAKNYEGYKRLIKIFSEASRSGFYYEFRSDFNALKSIWNDNDLKLCVPFYDSFLYKNVLGTSICVPDFGFTKPVFFVEENNLPFDYILKSKIEEFCSKNNFSYLNTKSIYYKNKSDFKSYLTFRCISNRTTLNKPEFSHMCSSEFSFESWKEKNA